MLNEANQQKVQQKLNDGKLQESAGNKDSENFVTIGGGKGKKGKK